MCQFTRGRQLQRVVAEWSCNVDGNDGDVICMDHDRLAKQLEQLVPDLRRRAEALRALGSISDGFPAGQAADQRLAEADRVERLVGLYRAGEVDGLRIELYALAYGLIRDGAVKLDT